jgi:hypothetical protein
LAPVGSSAVHIYTQNHIQKSTMKYKTQNRTEQNRTEQNRTYIILKIHKRKNKKYISTKIKIHKLQN